METKANVISAARKTQGNGAGTIVPVGVPLGGAPQRTCKGAIMGTFSMIFIALCLGVFSVKAEAQDLGQYDTARTLIPTIALIDCQPTIRVSVPVFLYAVEPIFSGSFRFHWNGEATCDSIAAAGVWATYADYVEFTIDNSLKTASFIVATHPLSPSIPPSQEVVAQIYLTAGTSDTFDMTFPRSYFQMQFGLGPFQPKTQYLDRVVAVPDTFVLHPGNADCSDHVSIADVVFLINYIFSGGMPPYDRNAADPDASCAISIADAVYLINYIFAGGNAPQAGCVAP